MTNHAAKLMLATAAVKLAILALLALGRIVTRRRNAVQCEHHATTVVPELVDGKQCPAALQRRSV